MAFPKTPSLSSNSELSLAAKSLLLVVSAGCATPPPASQPATEPPAEKTPLQAEARQEPGSEAGRSATDPVGRGSMNDVRAAEDTPAPGTRRAPDPIPSGTKVLHVGDSFAGALGLPLSALLEQEGVRSVLKHTDSSYLTDWAWDGNLQKYVWKYNPDLIIITLGANELGIAQPERRERTVKKIISVIGERPCVWVAIPLWRGRQNGLMDVIEEHVSPCLFMDTNELLDVDGMPRISDGIHPTTTAREEWASFVLDWLKNHRDPEEGRPWHLVP